jgi:protein-tyrosine phosphatase
MDEIQHPNRGLDIESARNVRDLGGYSTQDGGSTQWGRFVRSGDMDQMTQADQEKLIAYGIKSVIDLRMAHEIAAAPNVFARSQEANFYIHDFWGDRFDNYRSIQKKAPPEVKLADLYCSGLDKSGFIMAEIMSTIADSEDVGFAFQCRSGKDRTGLVAAILLAIAGVPDATICADYALTATFLKTSEDDQFVDPTTPGFYQRGCAPETMARTLAFLQENYSGVEGYLRHVGISDQQLLRIRAKLRD